MFRLQISSVAMDTGWLCAVRDRVYLLQLTGRAAQARGPHRLQQVRGPRFNLGDLLSAVSRKRELVRCCCFSSSYVSVIHTLLPCTDVLCLIQQTCSDTVWGAVPHAKSTELICSIFFLQQMGIDNKLLADAVFCRRTLTPFCVRVWGEGCKQECNQQINKRMLKGSENVVVK